MSTGDRSADVAGNQSAIRILHLEDNSRDAGLIQDLLEAGGGTYEFTRAVNRKQFEDSLAMPEFDLIICDFNLPDLDGLAALRLARERFPGTPVIIASGAIDPEEAGECLRAGATDYLLKHRLERLPSAARRALEEARTRRQQREIEASLRESEERYRAIVEDQSELIARWDFTHGVTFVNDAVCRYLSLPRSEILGRSFYPYVYEDDRPAVQAHVASLSCESPVGSIEHRLRLPDGSVRWSQWTDRALFDAAGRLLEFQSVGRDITERRQAEAALLESEMRFRAVAENLGDGLVLTDLDDVVLDVNPRLTEMTGYTRADLVGHHAYEFLNDASQVETMKRHNADRAEGRSSVYEIKLRRKDGSRFDTEITGAPLRNSNGEIFGTVGVVRDITQRKQGEQLTLRTQRLEAIGTLAGGIAHDLNNVLAPILMGVEFLKAKYPDATGILDRFETCANRGAGMVRQLLTFAKGAEGERVSIQPAHLVKEIKDMIQGTFPKNIELLVRCPAELPTVSGDPTQLHQILLNLCVNARDAMPAGGTLTLEAQEMEVDDAYATAVTDARPGTYLALRVQDTGMGIPPEILDRIFDPFFTTKAPDKGTGLGLSSVMGIVKGHGGFLHVQSSPGRGSTFTAHLPAETAGLGVAPVVRTGSAIRGRGETILFVDDEKPILDVGRQVLMSLNFKVVTATDGVDGLMKAAEHRNELCAIITDMHMPHMDGLAFVRALRRVLPDIPVMIGSGRLDEPVATELKTFGVIHRLDKPYTQDMLTGVLASLLGDGRQSGG